MASISVQTLLSCTIKPSSFDHSLVPIKREPLRDSGVVVITTIQSILLNEPSDNCLSFRDRHLWAKNFRNMYAFYVADGFLFTHSLTQFRRDIQSMDGPTVIGSARSYRSPKLIIDPRLQCSAVTGSEEEFLPRLCTRKPP